MYRQLKAVWHMIDCIWPMSYRCTCSKRVGCHGETRDNTLVYSALSFGCRGYDGLQPARVPTCPLTCRKRDLGAGRVGPAVPLAVWSGPVIVYVLFRLPPGRIRIRIDCPSGD